MHHAAAKAVLLLDDDASFLEEMSRTLRSNDLGEVVSLQDGSRLLDELASGRYGVLLMDWVMPGLTGAELLPQVVRRFPSLPVVVITGVNDLQNVVSCIKLGAFDYITKPLDTGRLVTTVQKARTVGEMNSQNRRLSSYMQGEPLQHPELFGDMVTSSPRMLAVFKVVESMAGSRLPILICGEAGVGKGALARTIHDGSGLTGAMVTLDLAGLDEVAFRECLFGRHGAGGAGALESAAKGSLLLRNVAKLRPASQADLMHLLQENRYYRVGGGMPRKSAVRIMATAGNGLKRMVESGEFRSDLYYRLSGHTLYLPPLRERREDILPIAERCLDRIAHDQLRRRQRLSRDLRRALVCCDYDENVRELCEMIHAATELSAAELLQLNDFPGLSPIGRYASGMLRNTGNGGYELHRIFAGFPKLDDLEQALVEQALVEARGNRSAAAELLGISRPTLLKRLERYGLQVAL